MNILTDIKFWKSNLHFLNKIGGEAAHKKREYEIKIEDKDFYLEFMKKEGFDNDENYRVEAEFHKLQTIGMKKAMKRVKDNIEKFKQIEA